MTDTRFSAVNAYASLQDWLNEAEGYAVRAERIPPGAYPWIAEAWKLGAASVPAQRQPYPADLIRELCGDELNGGFIRDLCFTVWNICHSPTHADGNADWSGDTLPTVQSAVAIIREKLSSLTSTSRETPCSHEAIIGLDGTWHCQRCGDAIDMAVAFTQRDGGAL